MPVKTNIILIRHAEKPNSGPGLAIAGEERAQAYVVFFQNLRISGKPITFDYIFSCADSPNSCRPRLTVQPLADAMKLKIKQKYAVDEFKKLKKEIKGKKKYNNCNILICWHHEKILDLASAFGADIKTLPASSNWPVPPWPNKIFGALLQISFDDKGEINTTQTKCFNQKLMYDDIEAEKIA